MRHSRLLLAAFSLILAAQCSYAQPIGDPTTWTYEVRKTGENKYRLVFHLSLKPHWHIWALQPGGDGTSIPPKFTFDKNPDFRLVGSVKEKGKMRSREELPGEPLFNSYEGKVEYSQDITVTGNVKITGKKTYQVCDESQCLPPFTNAFAIEIKDAAETSAPADTPEGAGQPDTSIVTSSAPLIPPVAGTADSGVKGAGGTEPAPPAEVMSIAGIFFSGLGSGLISVVTPCVFAMLPMTVSFFLKRSKNRKTGIRIALQYSLSIVLIFTVIGGLMSLLLGPDSLHAFSTNWIVNLFFFAIFLIFGISFLGAFEINLPSSWATKLDRKANTQNFVGIFFMALTLVVVSFSCTGPFIGSLLVAVQTGGKIGPLMGFFGFGLGLALPFSLFAIFPTLLNELGKSGGWLNAVKVSFGFIELALAMKFLSNADLTMGWRLLDREIFIAIWVALSFALGLYLLGIIRFSHDSELPKNDWGLEYLKVPRLFLGLAALIFALYLLPGMWGAPLRGMGAFVPPMGTFDKFGGAVSVAAAGNEGESSTRKYAERMKIYEPAAVINLGLEVFYDYEEALEASKKANKPVMLDFTGINCVNCRKFESEVWSNAEVMSRMKNDFIIASLFTDATEVPLPASEQRYSEASQKKLENLGDKNVDLQITKFRSNTQPFYFFVDGSGTQLADKGISYPTKPIDFVNHLDAVKARYKALHP
jgi:thiol:disulfide interchange protein DsbD